MGKRIAFGIAAAALLTSTPARGSDAADEEKLPSPSYEHQVPQDEATPAAPSRERDAQDLESRAGRGSGAGEPAAKVDERREERRKQQEENHDRFLEETWGDS